MDISIPALIHGGGSEIDDDIDEHEDGAGHDRDALDQREITLQHGVDRQQAETG